MCTVGCITQQTLSCSTKLGLPYSFPNGSKTGQEKKTCKEGYLAENSAFPGALCILRSQSCSSSFFWMVLIDLQDKKPQGWEKDVQCASSHVRHFMEQDPNSSLQVTKGGGETWWGWGESSLWFGTPWCSPPGRVSNHTDSMSWGLLFLLMWPWAPK